MLPQVSFGRLCSPLDGSTVRHFLTCSQRSSRSTAAFSRNIRHHLHLSQMYAGRHHLHLSQMYAGRSSLVDTLTSRRSCILDAHFCSNPMGLKRLVLCLLGITAMHKGHSRFISSAATLQHVACDRKQMTFHVCMCGESILTNA